MSKSPNGFSKNVFFEKGQPLINLVQMRNQRKISSQYQIGFIITESACETQFCFVSVYI